MPKPCRMSEDRGYVGGSGNQSEWDSGSPDEDEKDRPAEEGEVRERPDGPGPKVRRMAECSSPGNEDRESIWRSIKTEADQRYDDRFSIKPTDKVKKSFPGSSPGFQADRDGEEVIREAKPTKVVPPTLSDPRGHDRMREMIGGLKKFPARKVGRDEYDYGQLESSKKWFDPGNSPGSSDVNLGGERKADENTTPIKKAAGQMGKDVFLHGKGVKPQVQTWDYAAANGKHGQDYSKTLSPGAALRKDVGAGKVKFPFPHREGIGEFHGTESLAPKAAEKPKTSGEVESAMGGGKFEERTREARGRVDNHFSGKPSAKGTKRGVQG